VLSVSVSLVTLRELRERATALKSGIETQRDRLADALQSMDYEKALACQIEVDRLKRDVRSLEPRRIG
jgi:hypothetical protein